MSNARNLSDIVGGNFDIPAGSLDNAVPANGSITTAKLADDAVTSAKLATGAVGADALSSSAISSGDLPSGTVLKVQTSYQQNSVTIANSGSGRVYSDLRSITYTPVASGNKLYIFATAGHSSNASETSRGAFGIVINVDGSRYDFGNYNWYDSLGIEYPMYPPDTTIHYGNVSTGSSDMTIKLEGYSYNESVGTMTPTFYGRALTIMEFAG
tara:strand:- start:5960 stop:6595 length:636 start_codon:yes stop_codon:yes gene_type:complete